MQIDVIKVKAVEKGPQFAGKLLNIHYVVKCWPDGVSKEEDPVVEKPVVVDDYSLSNTTPEQLAKQDARIADDMDEAGKEIMRQYLNEKTFFEGDNPIAEDRVDTYAATLQTTLRADNPEEVAK